MTNEERIYRLCECLIDMIDYLPPQFDWIVEERIKPIMKDIDDE